MATTTTTSEEEDPSRVTTNPDLLPTPQSQRTSTAWEFASLWIGLVFGLPSYYIAGALVEKGMNWWQGIIIIIVAKVILLFPLLLTSQPGTRYGIPFPVLARSAFGIRGAHVASLLRALVACGWFGIETWFGGQVVYLMLPSSLTHSSFANPISWLATSPLELVCFAIFWLAQLALLYKGMNGVRELEKYSAPILVLLSLLLLAWACVKAGGFGRMIYTPSRLSPSEFWSLFFPSLTANVGSWAPMALSITDFTRYARSQRDHVLGQLGLPLFMATFTFIGLAVTSSTEVIFGRTISNPIDLLATIGGTLPMLIAIPGLFLAIVTTNIPANIVAPSNTLVSLNPSFFSFKRGAFITGLIGTIVFQPWRIVKSSDNFVYTWLVGYSAVMGPIAGILLSDYYLIRRTKLNLTHLYSVKPQGIYYYYKGYNLVALTTLVVTLAPIMPGFLHKLGLVKSMSQVLIFIYKVGWFFGFFTSGVMYFAMFRCVDKISTKCGGSSALCDELLLPTMIVV